MVLVTIPPRTEGYPNRPLPEAFATQLYSMMAGPMARLRDEFGIDYT